jgi:predicted metal-binding membrane protein
MAMLVVVGVMSVTWMAVIAAAMVAQNVWPPRPSSMFRSR